jgi:protein TonB
MRLATGKRIGQSGRELGLTVVFSFIVHALAFAASLIVMHATPKYSVPPAYHVNLVDQPAESLAPFPETPPQPPEPPAKKAEPKAATAAPKAKSPAMPELASKPAKKEPAGEPDDSRKAGRRRESVAVATPQGFTFPPYLFMIRDKIERNWNPPPGAVEVKAKVVFAVHRSGRVLTADLAEASGNFYFDQAAMRAVLQSGPFPPFPEGLYSEQMVFSVDLMESE